MVDVYEFWGRLDASLKRNKKSIRSLCKETQVPYQTIVNQRGQGRYPSVEVIIKFSQALDVSADWLLFGTRLSIEKELMDIAKKLKEAGSSGLDAINSLKM